MPTTGDLRAWALVRGEANATAYGPLEWIAGPSDVRARAPVAADNYAEGDVWLEMTVRPRAQDEPTVTLIAAAATVRHVDVNGTHRGADRRPRRQTHVQGEPPPGFIEWIDPDSFPSIPESGTVGGETYYRVFAAAARLLHVNISAVEWNDPPEGRL